MAADRTQASRDLEGVLARFAPQLKSFSTWLLSTLTGLGFAPALNIDTVCASTSQAKGSLRPISSGLSAMN